MHVDWITSLQTWVVKKSCHGQTLINKCSISDYPSNFEQNLSKVVKVKCMMTSLWRLWRHLCSVEYWKLLKTVCIEIDAASSSFIWSYSNLAETFSTNTTFDWKSWIWINRCFSWFDYVINIMPAFLTNTVSFSAIFQKFYFSDTYYKKVWYSWNIYQNRKTCDTESINMWILSWRSLSFHSLFEYYVIMTS